MTINEIKEALSREYGQVTGTIHEEVHKFVAWLEGRQSAIDSAVKLLQGAGYTVTKP